MKSDHRFYVYILFRPWNGVPCYVGKGHGSRVHVHARLGPNHHNKHLASVFKKAGAPLPFVIVMATNDEAEVFAWEAKLIKAIGRADLRLGPLCNCTDGGEGGSGRLFSAETLAKKSANAKAQFLKEMEEGFRPCNSPESRAKIAASNRGQKRTSEFREAQRAAGKIQFAREMEQAGGRPCTSPEANAKGGRSRIGNRNAAGRTQSPEERAMRSIATKLGIARAKLDKASVD